MDPTPEAEALLQLVCGFLYEGRPGDWIPMAHLRQHFPDDAFHEVFSALQSKEVMTVQIDDSSVRLTALGRRACLLHYVPELVFGFPYIGQKYEGAVLHIIVRIESGEGAGKETAGTTPHCSALGMHFSMHSMHHLKPSSSV